MGPHTILDPKKDWERIKDIKNKGDLFEKVPELTS